tara:strand:+ start:231 stop:461 length:231 start_codon:yes stop_codon:yes gene_type:complete
MKFIIVLNLLAITTINPLANAHENHDHQIYSWSNSKNKTIKSDNNVNSEKLKGIKNKEKTKNKSSQKFLEDNQILK